ncbi:MAG: GIY-YIG nuclease family protein [Opitutales bacterium]|nr:GIY-YIG nuclease family protein [Opitutales bacterium]
MAGHFQKGTIHLPEGLSRVECPEPVEGLSFVYILICRNRTLYVGQTQNIRERLDRHMTGTGARHTQRMKEFLLVYTEGPLSSERAVQRERQLKKWSRAKKLALIRGDMEALRRLSKSRD